MKPYSHTKRQEENQGKNIWISLFVICVLSLFTAISVVWFFAPVLSDFGDWIEASMKRQFYFLLCLITVLGTWVMYQFKKRYF